METKKLINKDAFDILYEEATKDSANYIKKYISEVIITDGGWWNVALSKIEVEGLCMELGVYEGKSINFFSKHAPKKTWYGFDSFLGFQEDWKGGYFSKGNFSLKGKPPLVNSNVKLIKGYFKDTLPDFLKGMDKFTILGSRYEIQNISFLHFDCDTYESTIEALDIIGPERLVPGTRILFDEYISYIGWRYGEYRAWQEFVKKNNLMYKYELFGLRQALVKII